MVRSYCAFVGGFLLGFILGAFLTFKYVDHISGKIDTEIEKVKDTYIPKTLPEEWQKRE